MNRRWTLQQKQAAVERMKTCGHRQLARELGIQKRQLYEWRAQLEHLEGKGAASSREEELERENRRLRETLARKVMEADFLQGALRRIEARRQAREGSGETASTKKSRK